MIESCQIVHLQEIFCRVANVVMLSTLLEIAFVLNTLSILLNGLFMVGRQCLPQVFKVYVA